MYKLGVGKMIGAATLAGVCLLTFGATTFAQGTAETVTVEAAVVNAEGPGVLIVSVQDDSPAATSGLHRGDIVLEVDGAPVNSPEELQAALMVLNPGDEVTLTVQHGDDQNEVVVALGDRNGQSFLGIIPFGPVGPAAIVRGEAQVVPGAGAGIRIMPLPGMLHISSTMGVHVQEVLPDSPAAAAGLQAGDQVIAVDGEPLAPGGDLAALIAGRTPGDEITLEVQRGYGAGENLEVVVTLGENPDKSGAAFLGIRMAPLIFSHAERIAGRGPQGPIRDQLRFFRAPRMNRFHFYDADPFMAAPAMPAMPPMMLAPYSYSYGAPAMPPMMVAPYGYGAPGFAPFAAPQGDTFFWMAPVQPGWMQAPMFQFHAAPFAIPYEPQKDQKWIELAQPDVMFEAAPVQKPAEPAKFEIVLDEAI